MYARKRMRLFRLKENQELCLKDIQDHQDFFEDISLNYQRQQYKHFNKIFESSLYKSTTKSIKIVNQENVRAEYNFQSKRKQNESKGPEVDPKAPKYKYQDNAGRNEESCDIEPLNNPGFENLKTNCNKSRVSNLSSELHSNDHYCLSSCFNPANERLPQSKSHPSWIVYVKENSPSKKISSHHLHAGTITIGRAKCSDIRIKSQRVSKTHAKLEIKDSLDFHALRSKNGISINKFSNIIRNPISFTVNNPCSFWVADVELFFEPFTQKNIDNNPPDWVQKYKSESNPFDFNVSLGSQSRTPYIQINPGSLKLFTDSNILNILNTPAGAQKSHTSNSPLDPPEKSSFLKDHSEVNEACTINLNSQNNHFKVENFLQNRYSEFKPQHVDNTNANENRESLYNPSYSLQSSNNFIDSRNPITTDFLPKFACKTSDNNDPAAQINETPLELQRSGLLNSSSQGRHISYSELNDLDPMISQNDVDLKSLAQPFNSTLLLSQNSTLSFPYPTSSTDHDIFKSYSPIQLLDNQYVFYFGNSFELDHSKDSSQSTIFSEFLASQNSCILSASQVAAQSPLDSGSNYFPVSEDLVFNSADNHHSIHSEIDFACEFDSIDLDNEFETSSELSYDGNFSHPEIDQPSPSLGIQNPDPDFLLEPLLKFNSTSSLLNHDTNSHGSIPPLSNIILNTRKQTTQNNIYRSKSSPLFTTNSLVTEKPLPGLHKTNSYNPDAAVDINTAFKTPTILLSLHINANVNQDRCSSIFKIETSKSFSHISAQNNSHQTGINRARSFPSLQKFNTQGLFTKSTSTKLFKPSTSFNDNQSGITNNSQNPSYTGSTDSNCSHSCLSDSTDLELPKVHQSTGNSISLGLDKPRIGKTSKSFSIFIRNLPRYDMEDRFETRLFKSQSNLDSVGLLSQKPDPQSAESSGSLKRNDHSFNDIVKSVYSPSLKNEKAPKINSTDIAENKHSSFTSNKEMASNVSSLKNANPKYLDSASQQIAIDAQQQFSSQPSVVIKNDNPEYDCSEDSNNENVSNSQDIYVANPSLDSTPSIVDTNDNVALIKSPNLGLECDHQTSISHLSFPRSISPDTESKMGDVTTKKIPSNQHVYSMNLKPVKQAKRLGLARVVGRKKPSEIATTLSKIPPMASALTSSLLKPVIAEERGFGVGFKLQFKTSFLVQTQKPENLEDKSTHIPLEKNQTSENAFVGPSNLKSLGPGRRKAYLGLSSRRMQKKSSDTVEKMGSKSPSSRDFDKLQGGFLDIYPTLDPTSNRNVEIEHKKAPCMPRSDRDESQNENKTLTLGKDAPRIRKYAYIDIRR
ncbi:hypothetical protein BB560_000831 [Smittium megazygosporum]|uniref:FHA domain-containing protein n=1 Tax=Smittium megazygosporum TaxID=133381 RepID=A0A2T9ZJA9_9FUNG|nr:hypothetical protein BB560_000831 [Smittium megazygosporum]